MNNRALPPDPEGMNDDRALWAETALQAFTDATGCDRHDALCDLLADLMHWCDRNEETFTCQLDRARFHYVAETLGDDAADLLFQPPTKGL